MEGLLSTGPTQSSFLGKRAFAHSYTFHPCYLISLIDEVNKYISTLKEYELDPRTERYCLKAFVGNHWAASAFPAGTAKNLGLTDFDESKN